MGGVEDDGPPSKRVKLSLEKSEGNLNNSSLAEIAKPLGGLMANSFTSNGKDEVIGSKGVIKRVEFVRIITKALYSLGYEKSGALLEEESGIHLHSDAVNFFRENLLRGNWDESVTSLRKIGIMDEEILKSASFLILEHKFFELLESNKVMDALKTLRREIAPLCINRKRVHELSSCIVSPLKYGFHGYNGQGVNGVSRMKLLEKLQDFLPPTIMIPERRLEHLVEQALNVQKESCVFHNSLDSSLSLYTDHRCGRGKIPSRTLQVLHGHSDDVWFIRFSNNGKYLASSSNDRTAIIWKIHDGWDVTLKHTLVGHQKPVLMVAWSPDDSMLLTCGMGEVVRCWDVNSGECIHVYEKSGLGMNSCGWFPDGKSLVTGLADRSICAWDLDAKELEYWKGQRTILISDIAVATNKKWIISICKENAILLFDRETKVERLIEEEQTIISFSLSRDDNFLLVSLLNQEIHLWSVADNFRLVSKYRGHKRSRFVIRSCFGGFEEGFIASGSEDSQVYIWHKSSQEPVSALSGHSGTVNCVSWNPVNPHMLASGSDDNTIRIWGLNKANAKRKDAIKDAISNGVVYCNGNSK